MKKLLLAMLICSLALCGCKFHNKPSDKKETVSQNSEPVNDSKYSDVPDEKVPELPSYKGPDYELRKKNIMALREKYYGRIHYDSQDAWLFVDGWRYKCHTGTYLSLPTILYYTLKENDDSYNYWKKYHVNDPNYPAQDNLYFEIKKLGGGVWVYGHRIQNGKVIAEGLTYAHINERFQIRGFGLNFWAIEENMCNKRPRYNVQEYKGEIL